MNIEYKLYEYRSDKRITLAQLENKSGVSRSYLDDIENQRANPSVLTLCKIALALGAEPCDLFDIKQ